MAGLLADHYGTLVEKHGFESADFSLGEFSESSVRRKFAFAENGRLFSEGIEAGEQSLVTIGVTPTGPPHVGTLGQFLLAIALQRAGFDVQVVIADLAAYSAAGRDLETVRTLSRRYKSFVRELGFDATDGILRTQEEGRDALHTTQLLARYYGSYEDDKDVEEENEGNDGEDDEDAEDDKDDGGEADPDPTAFEEALEAAYADADTPGEATTDFAGQMVGLLLVVDSLHPVVKEGYENVALVVGADNAGMVDFFEDVLERSPYEATLAGLYTKLVGGLNDYPKLSKSLPDSRFTLADDPEAIRSHVLDPVNDAERPEQSIPFQMMRLASEYDAAELDRLHACCTEGGEEWEEAKRTYADYLLEVSEAWKRKLSG